jgi:hypothetical protein
MPSHAASTKALALGLLLLGACDLERCSASDEVRVLWFSEWKTSLAAPLSDRVVAAPAALIPRLREHPDFVTATVEAAPQTLSTTELETLRRALARLPEAVSRFATERLCGITTVTKLGRPGVTFLLKDELDQPVCGLLVLDLGAVTGEANAWASQREAACFRPNPAFELKVEVTDRAVDNLDDAYLLVLLHELGHVIADLLPSDRMREFSRLSWSGNAHDGFTSVFDEVMPERTRLALSPGKEGGLDGAEMPAFYDHLQLTSFPTPFAALHPREDFTESFANYAWAILAQLPYRVRVMQEGKEMRSFTPCWGQERCADKEMYFEVLLRNLPVILRR